MAPNIAQRLLYLTAQLDGVRAPERLRDALVEGSDRIRALEDVLRDIVMDYDVYVADQNPDEEDEWVKRARALLSDSYAGGPAQSQNPRMRPQNETRD